MKAILKNTAILLVITVVAASALSFVYELTKEPIAIAEQQKKIEAYQAVYGDAASYGEITDAKRILDSYNATLDGAAVTEVLSADAADGTRLGYVFTVVSNGYGGEIQFAYGVDVSGTVVGYDVISHSETPGYGAKCTDGFVREQFPGLTEAGQLDGITGATKTTNAMRRSVQAVIDLTKQLEGGSPQ